MMPVDRAARIVAGCYDVHRILMEIHKAEREAAEAAIWFSCQSIDEGTFDVASQEDVKEIIEAYRKHLEAAKP